MSLFWDLSTATASPHDQTRSASSLTTAAAFLRRFGVPTTGNAIGYAIPAPWQSGLSNGASAGGIIGLLVSLHAYLVKPMSLMSDRSTVGLPTSTVPRSS